MSKDRPLSIGDFLIVLLFLTVIISSIVITMSGIPFILIESETMSFWLIIIVPLAAICGGIIFTYSLAQYTITKQFRDLVLLLMALNIILNAFLYILTNEAFTTLSPFANRDRNRTLIIAVGLILAPSVLMGSLSTEEVTPKQKITVSLWGLLIVPSISLWFFFSPTPVFTTTPIGQGILGYTPIAWLAFIGLPLCMGLAIWKYLKSWRMTRNRLDFASGLALTLWFHSVLLFSSQSNPLQLMELIWYSVFVSGLFLIAIVVISSSLIEPRKTLTRLVHDRTIQLERSREESEFYLNVWGHKIGNLLQGMMLYLEMLSTGEKTAKEIEELAGTAIDIGRETTIINRQVAALIRVKEKDNRELSPVSLTSALDYALENAKDTVGAHCACADINLEGPSIQVLADDHLDLVFINLLTHICRENDEPDIQIQSSSNSNDVIITILSSGPPLPEDVRVSLLAELQPSKTTLSLDLFAVRLLMSRYNGSVEYTRNESMQLNEFRLCFKKYQSYEENQLGIHKEVYEFEKRW